ncbi:MAG: substrate-binding domain-containing protein [Lachnospiraceae bacterium]|nr:substrate-binding domain-containing protein [Lachnospiraceae bacterium]
MKKRFSVKNVILVYSIITFFVAAISFAVSFYFSRAVNLGSEEGDEHYDKYYVMITSEKDSDFWQSIYKGAYETGKENGIYVELLGDNLTKIYSDTELMNIAINSKPDGIIVYANESKDMTSLINTAAGKGIPVVTVYGDCANSSRCSFVGVDGFKLGKDYGKRIVNIINDGTAWDPEDKDAHDHLDVAVLVDSFSDNNNQMLVWSGIQNAIETDNNTEVKINLELKYINNSSPFTIEESVRDIVKSGDLADVIICLNGTNTNYVYQTMIDLNMAGRAVVFGYDDSESILRGILRNNIHFTMSADTYKMGSDCVMALKEYSESGYTSQFVLADVTTIDSSNILKYISESGEVLHEE